MINVAAICSVKNWPLSAGYGFASLFFYLLGALLFFLPVSLVSAELATGWPERGGIFVWVKEALGHKWGFLAIWLLWIENVVWYPTILTFIGATFAYSFNPALSDDTLYMFSVIFLAFWGATLINTKGMKVSGFISSFGAIVGTIVPGLLIIALGMGWFFSGKPLQINFGLKDFFPNLTNINQLVYLAGVILGFAGMEMSAVHARDVVKPQKNYPRAILLSALIIVGLSALGTLAIAAVVPQGKISLVSGSMEALKIFLDHYNMSWSLPILSMMIAFGALGQMSTWIVGPSRGLLAAAQSGELPPFLHKENRNGMPVNLLVIQGMIVSFLSCVFLFMPNVNSSFWILLVLVSQLYLVMYLLMFISAVVLRYKKDHVARHYRVPFGNIGMWLVASLGFLVSLATMVIGFIPPANLDTGNIVFYEAFLLIGTVGLCIVPFVILRFKKPSWN
jgi:putative glutamate/gamma-aminobutyrate antiporter